MASSFSRTFVPTQQSSSRGPQAPRFVPSYPSTSKPIPSNMTRPTSVSSYPSTQKPVSSYPPRPTPIPAPLSTPTPTPNPAQMSICEAIDPNTFPDLLCSYQFELVSYDVYSGSRICFCQRPDGIICARRHEKCKNRPFVEELEVINEWVYDHNLGEEATNERLGYIHEVLKEYSVQVGPVSNELEIDEETHVFLDSVENLLQEYNFRPTNYFVGKASDNRICLRVLGDGSVCTARHKSCAKGKGSVQELEVLNEYAFDHGCDSLVTEQRLKHLYNLMCKVFNAREAVKMQETPAALLPKAPQARPQPQFLKTPATPVEQKYNMSSVPLRSPPSNVLRLPPKTVGVMTSVPPETFAPTKAESQSSELPLDIQNLLAEYQILPVRYNVKTDNRICFRPMEDGSVCARRHRGCKGGKEIAELEPVNQCIFDHGEGEDVTKDRLTLVHSFLVGLSCQ